jgi:hypothetical protein
LDGHGHMFHARACTVHAAPRKGRDTGLFVIAVMSFIDLTARTPMRRRDGEPVFFSGRWGQV